MLQVKRREQITFLQSAALARIPGVVHAFSTRRGERNDFTLGPPSSPNPMVQMNRVRFLAAIGAAGWPILKLKQVHSGIVVDMDDTSAAGEAVEGDGAVTSLRDVALGVQTADCVPILIADSEGKAVAAIHAGWRRVQGSQGNEMDNVPTGQLASHGEPYAQSRAALGSLRSAV